MVTNTNLPVEEKKIIYNAIIRFHKEFGTIGLFRNGKMTFKLFEKAIDKRVNWLTQMVWVITRNHYRKIFGIGGKTDAIAGIKASIVTINFTENLLSSNSTNKIIVGIGEKMIVNELSYVFSVLIESYDDVITMPSEVKDDFIKLWRLHKNLVKPGVNWGNTIEDSYKILFPDN